MTERRVRTGDAGFQAASRRATSRHSARGSQHWLVHHAVSIAVALVFVVPLVWVVSASLRRPRQPPPSGIEWLPSPIAWSNYREIFDLVPLGDYMLNSMFVSAIAVPLTLVTASWAGFAMAQLGARARHQLLAVSIMLRMIPITALWLTRFILVTRFGLVDSLWALILPALMGSSPFFVLLFYWSFRRIPAELYESARLEGAGALRVWWSIAMPLAVPTVVAVGVLTFVDFWADFINPLLYLRSDDNYTLPLGLQTLQQLDRTNWPLLMAGSVLMTAPILVVFLLSQRFLWRLGRNGAGTGQVP
jgi:multiple sugar transport system permease protein